MPNWCKGRLRISGKPELIKRFVAYACSKSEGNDNILDADRFIPRPRIEGEVFSSNQWCAKHWGTKWGMCEAELVAENYELGVVEYAFETAWSPCGPVVEAMSKRFPELLFVYSYVEPWGGFEGYLVCMKGKVIQHKHEEFKA